jgi:hypothetical protein
MPRRTEQPDNIERALPDWFAAFLADRDTREPLAHTLKAYYQDFDAIATLIAGGEDPPGMALADITIDIMRTAFAQYAETHEAASIQRCWSTWNVVCTFLYTAELIVANPMPMVGRPKLAKTLPKALPADAVAALLATPHRPASDPGTRSAPSKRASVRSMTGPFDSEEVYQLRDLLKSPNRRRVRGTFIQCNALYFFADSLYCQVVAKVAVIQRVSLSGEVVPGLVEVEVAVPRSRPAVW